MILHKCRHCPQISDLLKERDELRAKNSGIKARTFKLPFKIGAHVFIPYSHAGGVRADEFQVTGYEIRDKNRIYVLAAPVSFGGVENIYKLEHVYTTREEAEKR